LLKIKKTQKCLKLVLSERDRKEKYETKKKLIEEKIKRDAEKAKEAQLKFKEAEEKQHQQQ
jgi:hypothetical protein